MCEDDLARTQAQLLRRAVDQAGLPLHEVWRYYFSIGGNAGELELEAYLHQAFPLPTLERDVLAHAVNEMIDHRPILYAPYSGELEKVDRIDGDPAAGRGHGQERYDDET